MVTMLDSVNVENLPHDPGYWYAGYVDGDVPTMGELRGRFGHTHRLISITTGTGDAEVIDCERGDATPAEAAQWVHRRWREGYNPVVYCGQDAYHEIEGYLQGYHPAPGRHYWIADWTNEPHIAFLPRVVGTQWADGSDPYPGLARWCDSSLVDVEGWPSPLRQSFPVVPSHPPTKEVVVKLPSVMFPAGIMSLLRSMAAAAGIGLALANEMPLAPTAKAVLVGVCGWILREDHVAAKSKDTKAP